MHSPLDDFFVPCGSPFKSCSNKAPAPCGAGTSSGNIFSTHMSQDNFMKIRVDVGFLNTTSNVLNWNWRCPASWPRKEGVGPRHLHVPHLPAHHERKKASYPSERDSLEHSTTLIFALCTLYWTSKIIASFQLRKLYRIWCVLICRLGIWNKLDASKNDVDIPVVPHKAERSVGNNSWHCSPTISISISTSLLNL